MGTPEFAVPGLELLIENNYNIVAVITAPDKPQGRGLKLAYSPIKSCAIKHNIPVLQPEKLKEPIFLDELKRLNADLQIVVAFRMLPEAVWNMPPLGTFNLHASLLPQYRGAAPIHWAVINGEKETGVTTFFLNHEIDTGDLILQAKEPIHSYDTTGSLYERLMQKGASIILKTVELIEKNQVKAIPQVINEDLKTAPKIFKENCRIDWSQTAVQIRNFVRGLAPNPTAFTLVNRLNCKLFTVSIVELQSEEMTGKISTDCKTYVHVSCGKGSISIDELQLEGKKRMNIKEFLAGNKFETIS
jgi:methionyl-tRNA formyltransferase